MFILFYFYRNLPTTKKIKERIYSGYWDRSPEESYRIEMIKRNLSPDTKDLLRRKEELMTRKEDPITPIKI